MDVAELWVSLLGGLMCQNVHVGLGLISDVKVESGKNMQTNPSPKMSFFNLSE